MRFKAVLTAAALLAAACNKQGDARPILRDGDRTPYTSLSKKTHVPYAAFLCPGCGNAVEPGAAQCDKPGPHGGRCKTKLGWPEKYVCPKCEGTGSCRACVLYGGEGKCWKCGGAGWTRENVACPNCADGPAEAVGKCPICAGTNKCDWCGGKEMEGGRSFISRADLEAKKPPAETAGAAPPADAAAQPAPATPEPAPAQP
jgi:hypothetical protein